MKDVEDKFNEKLEMRKKKADLAKSRKMQKFRSKRTHN